MRIEPIGEGLCPWCWNKLDGETVDLGVAQAHKACDDRMKKFFEDLGEWTE